MTRDDLHNAIRLLFNIDRGQLPELNDAQWRKFQDDPPMFFIRCDDATCDAIWREANKRRKPSSAEQFVRDVAALSTPFDADQIEFHQSTGALAKGLTGEALTDEIEEKVIDGDMEESDARALWSLIGRARDLRETPPE